MSFNPSLLILSDAELLKIARPAMSYGAWSFPSDDAFSALTIVLARMEKGRERLDRDANTKNEIIADLRTRLQEERGHHQFCDKLHGEIIHDISQDRDNYKSQLLDALQKKK